VKLRIGWIADELPPKTIAYFAQRIHVAELTAD